jgi:hypothetical protein
MTSVLLRKRPGRDGEGMDVVAKVYIDECG